MRGYRGERGNETYVKLRRRIVGWAAQAFMPLTVMATIAARYATAQAVIVVTILLISFASRPAFWRTVLFLCDFSIHPFREISSALYKTAFSRLCIMHKFMKCRNSVLHFILHFALHAQPRSPASLAPFRRLSSSICRISAVSMQSNAQTCNIILHFCRILLQNQPAGRLVCPAGRSIFPKICENRPVPRC